MATKRRAFDRLTEALSSLAEDIEAFAVDYGGDVELIRLAVTPEHSAIFGLPSAPPKASDRRRFRR
jgi:hypothetical protein